MVKKSWQHTVESIIPVFKNSPALSFKGSFSSLPPCRLLKVKDPIRKLLSFTNRSFWLLVGLHFDAVRCIQPRMLIHGFESAYHEIL